MLEMNHLSRLSPDEEAHLLDRVVRGNRARHEGSVNHLVLTDAFHARNVLVEEYQRLVISLARRYHRQCKRLELLDLIQEGSIGVIEALNRYDGTSPKGGTFKRTLVAWIAGVMAEAIRSQDYQIRFPSKADKQMKDFFFARDRLYLSLQRPPLLEEIAAELHFSIDKVRELADYVHRQAVTSLHQKLNDETDTEFEEVVDIVPLYAAPVASSPARTAAVRDALSTLPARQRQIVEMRHGLAEDDGRERSQLDVSSELGLRNSNIQKG